MAWLVEVPDEVWDQIEALPDEARALMEDVVDDISADPWKSLPIYPGKDRAQVRKLVFGPGNGLIVFVIVEYVPKVVIERVLWMPDLG